MTETNSFFKDHSGKKSSMRLMSFIALLMACSMAIIQTFQVDISYNINMVGMFLLAAFCPKVLQTVAERWTGGGN